MRCWGSPAARGTPAAVSKAGEQLGVHTQTASGQRQRSLILSCLHCCIAKRSILIVV